MLLTGGGGGKTTTKKKQELPYESILPKVSILHVAIALCHGHRHSCRLLQEIALPFP